MAFVEAFLEKKWVTVLTLAYEQQDDQPQQVEEALKTMDDLVWSVKPKITAAERKALIAKLPSMIADLNKWLDLIKWNPSTRARFFAELAWVSPMRNFYLFSTREKQEARQMTAEELALALREQRARVVRITGLIGRVLTEALCPESAKNEATRKSVA